MDDLRTADVDFLTIGQYLQPTRKHAPVERFVEPAEFESYKAVALAKGFLVVASSPLTRSSYHAGEDFARLKGGSPGTSCQPGECVTYPSPGRFAATLSPPASACGCGHVERQGRQGRAVRERGWSEGATR